MASALGHFDSPYDSSYGSDKSHLAGQFHIVAPRFSYVFNIAVVE